VLTRGRMRPVGKLASLGRSPEHGDGTDGSQSEATVALNRVMD
jgi:hypothetical protein